MYRRRKINMFAIGLLAACILFGAMGQISLKTGMTQMDRIESISELFNARTVMSIFGNPYVLLGLTLYAFSAFLWLGGLSTLDVSFMYPMLSLSYLITSLMAVVLLSESVSTVRWAGTAMVVIGCFLIMRS